MHYGEQLIEAQKREQRYGRVFTYDEYQQIHALPTCEAFTEWLRDSRFVEAVAHEDPVTTWHHLQLLHDIYCTRSKVRELWRSPSVWWSLTLVPLVLTLVSWLRIHRWQRKRRKL